MSVPYMGNDLKGWAKKRKIRRVDADWSTGERVEVAKTEIVRMNIAPMPAERIKQKPEDQWSWKWWSVVICRKTPFSIDDIIEVQIGQDLRYYRILSIEDWTMSGFCVYDAVEDYEENIPEVGGQDATGPSYKVGY